MSYEDDVMFRMGVFEDEANASRLEAMAKSVETAMASISSSIRGVGATFESVSGRMRQEAGRAGSSGPASGSGFGGGSSASVDTARQEAEARMSQEMRQQNDLRREALDIAKRQAEESRKMAEAAKQSAAAQASAAGAPQWYNNASPRKGSSTPWRQMGPADWAANAHGEKEEFVKPMDKPFALSGPLRPLVSDVVEKEELRKAEETARKKIAFEKMVEDDRKARAEEAIRDAEKARTREAETMREIADNQTRLQEIEQARAQGNERSSEELLGGLMEEMTAYRGIGDELERIRPLTFRSLMTDAERGLIGLTKFTSGLAYLGLASKDASGKLAETGTSILNVILSIKGAGDTAIGAIKGISSMVSFFDKLSRGMEDNRRRQDLLNQQQEAGRRVATMYVAVLNQLATESRVAGMSQDQLAENLGQVEIMARRAGVELRDLASAEGSLPSGGGVGGRGRRGRAGSGMGASVGGAVGSEVGQLLGGGSIGSVVADRLGERLGSLVEGRMDGLFTKIGTKVSDTLGRVAGSRMGGMAMSLGGSIAGSTFGGMTASGGAAAISGGGAAGLVASTGPLAALGAAAVGTVASLNLLKETLIDGKAIQDTSNAKAAESMGLVWAADMVGTAQKYLSDTAGSIGNYLGGEMGEKIGRALTIPMVDLRGASTAAEKARGALLDLELAVSNNVLAMNAATQAEQSIRLGGSRKMEELGNSHANRMREAGQLQSGRDATPSEKMADAARDAARYSQQYAESIELIKHGQDGVVLSTEREMEERKRAVGLSQQMEGAIKSQISAVRAVADEQKAANEKQIEGLKKTQDEWRKTGEAARGSLQSAAERFADLDDKSQAKYKKALEDARNQAASGRGVSLSREQEASLSRVGDEESQRLLSQSKTNRARSAGFFAFSGQDEQRKIAESQMQQRQLGQQIAGREQANAGIDQRAQGQVDRLAGGLRGQINQTSQMERSVIQNQVVVELKQNATAVYAATLKALTEAMPKQKKELEAMITKQLQDKLAQYEKESSSTRRNSGV